MTTVTIAVAINETEDLIEGCLASISAQGYADLDILCVNAGGLDNAVTIVKEAAAVDPRIRLLNCGNSAKSGQAWTAAATEAKGRYVLLMGGRDRLAAGAIEACVRALGKPGARFVAFSAGERLLEPRRPGFPSALLWRDLKAGVVDLAIQPVHIAELFSGACRCMWATEEVRRVMWPSALPLSPEMVLLRCAAQSRLMTVLPEELLWSEGRESAGSGLPDLALNEECHALQHLFRWVTAEFPDSARSAIAARAGLNAYARLLRSAPERSVEIADAFRSLVGAIPRSDLYLHQPPHLTFQQIRMLKEGITSVSIQDCEYTRDASIWLQPKEPHLVGDFEMGWVSGEAQEVRFEQHWSELRVDYDTPRDLSSGFLRAFVKIDASAPLLLRFSFLCQPRLGCPGHVSENVLELYRHFPPGVSELWFRTADMGVLSGNPDPARVSVVLFGGQPGSGVMAATLAQVLGEKVLNLLDGGGLPDPIAAS